MIYFDEAGNSGPNLLDDAQPLFTILSHDYNSEEVQQILSPLLDVCGAEELHFKQLKKYPKYQKPLIDCLNHPLIDETRIYFSVAHKKYMIVGQIVDRLIEPVFYDYGYDIYQEGYNIALTNVLFIMGQNLWDKELFEQMCSSFVKIIRQKERTVAEINEFYAIVSKLNESIGNNEGRAFIAPLLESKDQIWDILENTNAYILDVTLSSFLVLCHFWTEKKQSPYDILMDPSKNIQYWDNLIKYLISISEKVEVGFGSRKYTYPLLINSISVSDSAENLPIQLADVLASALNYAFTKLLIQNNSNDKLANEIVKSRIAQINHHAIWPTDNVTPESLGMKDATGVNPLDFLARKVAENGANFKK